MHGPFLAAIEAAGLVDAHLAFAGEAELLDALLGVVAQLAGALVVAADAAAVALVAAEEDVLARSRTCRDFSRRSSRRRAARKIR